MKSLLFFTLLILSINLFGQDRFISEKVYLHTDRDQYVAGDTLLAKAYLFDATNHHLSTQSEVLFVSLLDDKGNLVLQQKHQLHQAQASIFMVLPKKIAPTTYQLVGHTRLMQNFADDFFFHKNITLVAPGVVTDKSVPTSTDSLSIQFFPEGGDMIVGLPCRVAFKTTLPNGKGLDVEGFIEDDKGERITDLTSAYLGMGVCLITPQQNTQYRAVVGNKRYNLPLSKTQGYALKVTTEQKGIYIEVLHNLPQQDSLHLWTHQRDKIIFQKSFIANKENTTFFLPNEQIPQEGILHITLFANNNIPLVERLSFAYLPQKRLQISAKRNTEKNAKSLLKFDISATNSEGEPLKNIPLSISVIDEGQLTDDLENSHLLSSILLNSDLKGTIEKPNSYFEMEDTKARFYLDNLMMTQGWRRFVWKDLKKQDTLRYEIEKSLILSGEVLNGTKLVRNKTVLLSMWTDKGLRINPIITNDKGRFELSGNWKGNLQIVATNTNRQEVSLMLDKPFIPSISKGISGLNVYASKQNFAENALLMQRLLADKTVLLDEVDVKAQKKLPYEDDDRRSMYGQPDISLEITPSIQSGAISVAKMLEGRIAGIKFGAFDFGANDEVPDAGNITQADVYATKSNSKGMGNTDGLLILVDGVMVQSFVLNMIQPSIVDRVDVLKDIAKVAQYGLRAGGGASGPNTPKVINILTKRGGMGETETFAGEEKSKWQGYALEREFYNPKYDEAITNSNPDRRATLYWNPNIKTDKNGNATVSFYNSDIAKRFRIAIEGTDGQGNVGSFWKVVE
jgi:TonB-dependent Receptor Plug Domain